ncbi:hypothetical protein [Pantoea sp. A4]|uniref:hypothetical protein n=1 Tax=Pantoea sp. A4 TaxID=1225184 RepID=UPI00037331E8|nr:hypothetical protein [Pantoea sp. A4]
MKSTLYHIDGLFQVVRQYYVSSFPYSVPSNAIDVMNYELKREGSSATIRYVDNLNTSFENLSPAENPETSFEHNPAVSLEEYLGEKQGREALLEDIRALWIWLVKAGYLYEERGNHTATEELLRTYRLTK